MTPVPPLDPATLRYAAALARTAASAARSMPDARAHHGCAAGAGEALAETFEEMAGEIEAGRVRT